MKNYRYILYTLTFALIFSMSCKESEDGLVTPDTDANLIMNGSFELNGVPTLKGWSPTSVDSSYVSFSNDTPTGGGSYSVKLKNGWTVKSTIWYSLLPPVGTHQYRFSVWAKAIRSNALADAGGEVILTARSSGAMSLNQSIHFTDTTWTADTLTYTLTTGSTDSLVITFRGNIDQSSEGYVLFDLCRFEKLD